MQGDSGQGRLIPPVRCLSASAWAASKKAPHAEAPCLASCRLITRLGEWHKPWIEFGLAGLPHLSAAARVSCAQKGTSSPLGSPPP